MRFLIKLLILGVVCYGIYLFFGPQVDALYAKAKTTVLESMKRDHSNTSGAQDDHQGRKYYPLEKRTQ